MTAPRDPAPVPDDDASADGYLWDGRGPVDPQLAALEAALRPLDTTRAAPDDQLAARRRRRRWTIGVLGVAAAAAAAVVLWPRAAPACARAHGFAFVATGAAARCDGATMARGELAPGARLDTGDAEVALTISDIGAAQVAPGSRLALRRSGPREHVLALERGALHARVTAPPRLFVVETPAATAVDLGCEYTLQIGDGGDGALEVRSGYVELSSSAGPVVVPAGYRAAITPGQGAGLPLRTDAPAALRDLRRGAIPTAAALAAARPTDALTLVHAALALDAAARGPLLARLAALWPMPPGTTLEAWRDAIVDGAPRPAGAPGVTKGPGKPRSE